MRPLGSTSSLSDQRAVWGTDGWKLRKIRETKKEANKPKNFFDEFLGVIELVEALWVGLVSLEDSVDLFSDLFHHVGMTGHLVEAPSQQNSGRVY